MSRLDRLFTLLSTSSSASTRHLAAKQLGEVQKLHPHELPSLLQRLHPLLRSNSWDTRIAASKALAAIVNEIPKWQCLTETEPVEENDPEIYNSLNWQHVKELGIALQAVEEDEDEYVVASSEDQLKRINCQLGLDVASKIGFIDSKDIVTTDDLQTQGQSQSKSDEGSHLSSRERNQLRRKQKRKTLPAKDDGQQCKKSRTAKTDHLWPTYSFDPEEDESVLKKESPLLKFCNCLTSELFHNQWEIRHGAATALREILKLRGDCCAMRIGDSDRENRNRQLTWLVETIVKLLWVISTDRFGDFISDDMIAPVRESSSMALAAILIYLSQSEVQKVVQLLLDLIKNEDWQSRHGGILAVKHFLSMCSKKVDSGFLLDLVYPEIFGCLSDEVDDVVSAAATALLPIASQLCLQSEKINPGLDSLVKVLSNILDGLDELSACTQSVMRLLEQILCLQTENKNLISCEELVLPLVSRLLPFLHNANSVVRHSSLKTLHALICTYRENQDFLAKICPSMLPHVFQRALLEPKNVSSDVIESIWFNMCQWCPIQPLLMTACPIYGSWFALIQGPTNHPLPGELLLPIGSSSSDWQYLGGVAAHGSTDDCERNAQSTRARCLCARLLGRLACCIALPAPGIDYSKEQLTPIEMFTEKVLLPPLQTRSAFRLLAVGLVISSWSDYNANQAKEVSASFKTQLLQLLTNDERYEEMALSWTELDSEVSKFESKLKQVVQVLPQLPLENWPVEQLCRQQGNINQGLVKELVEKHEEIVRMTSKIRFDEKMLDVLTKGSLSSSLVGMETLPEKLNPIIKPLMESIKYENNQDILTIVSHKLAKLLHLCILRGNTSASDKVLKNLMFFASNDPKSTPAVRYDHNNVDLGILSLENVSAGNQKTSSAESESHSFVQNQSRGSAKALETIVGHFGEEIREKLPSFHLWTFGRVLASDKTTLQDLTIALRTIEICIPRLSPSCLADVENMLTSFVDLLCHHSAAVRHLSSRCLAVFALQKLLRIPVISAFVEKVLPLLGSEHRHHRQGGVESIYVLINSLGIEIVPYIVLFIIPTLRKMSDQDPHIREIASGAFATLIKLIPLDSSCCSEALPDNLAIKKAEDKKFVEELVNIKNIENYSIDFPVNADLRSYQREGINWLAFLNRYGLHGILCDDMGLGKTLQSICILAGDHMKRRANFSVSGDTDNAPLPSLVICPATVCGHWKAEIEKFVGESILIPAVYSGSSQARQELRYPLKKLALSNDNVVIISSYEIVRNDLTFFCQFHWNYLILDEGHSIRNAKAKTTLAVKSLRANHRLILSGTPIQNSVLELWSLFDFLMPGFLGSERQFSVRYSRPIIASRGTSGTSSNVSKENQEAGALALEALHRQVLPFVLRRVKADVLKDLPPKITQDYYCDLSPLQVMLYEAYAEKQKSAVVKGTEDKRVRSHVFQALQYLRKVCNHPKLVLHPQHDLFPQIEDWLRVNNTTIDDIQNSAKLPALKELLRECNIGTETDENDILNGVVSQHRVLLFCQLKSMMDIVENDLLKRLHNVSYLRLDGSVPTNSRMSIVNRFNTDTSIDIFLLSTSVGGLGLNLTGADTVIFIEHDWNPMKDLQAMDRAHRIGQKKVVNVYRLITRNTLEEKIMGYQKFKLKTANTVISKDNSSLESMGKEQIFELFSLEKSTAAKKKDSGTGFKKFLENLPELWDERQYEDEFRINDEASSSSA